MARDIINEFVPHSGDDSQMILSYGWGLEVERPTAIVEANVRNDDGSLTNICVPLDWGSLCNLNKSVRRAMKHIQREVKKRDSNL